jgi:translation elongation factor EF-Ts
VSEQLSLLAAPDPLAEVERAAWSPGEGQGDCRRALNEAIQDAKAGGCSPEAIRKAGRRGTAKRERDALRIAAEASAGYVSRGGGW